MKRFMRFWSIDSGLIGGIIMGIIVYYFCQHSLTTAFENSRLLVKSTAEQVKVYAEASIVFPLIVAGAFIDIT